MKPGSFIMRLLALALLCALVLGCTACGGSESPAGSDPGPDSSQSQQTPRPATDPNAVAAIPGLGEYMAARSQEAIPLTGINFSYASYLYTDRDLFENAAVDHIELYINRVAQVDDNQFITVYLADAHTADIIQEFRFYALAQDLGSNTPKKVVSLYCPEPVRVGNGETLMFGAQGDPILWGYVQHDNSADPALKGFCMQSGFSNTNSGSILCVDVYLTDRVVEELVDPAVKELLSGKKLSILGDSITTFSGWSNGTDVNSTLGSNALYYPNGVLTDVDATWWKQTADLTGMEVLVNNAWAGSTVSSRTGAAGAGWNSRPGNLHDDTLGNNPGGEAILPDVIAVYLGINDSGNGVICNTDFDDTFWARVEQEDYVPQNMDDSYAVMIRKIRANYPDAVVFCFTLPESKSGAGTKLEPFNTAIRAVAEHYGCRIVDLNATVLSLYYSSYTSDNLHPTPEGMDIMTEAFLAALEDHFSSGT